MSSSDKEDLVLLAFEDRIEFLKGKQEEYTKELAYYEKMKADHLAHYNRPAKKRPGPAPGTPRKNNNGENNPSKQDDRLSSRDESVTLTEKVSPEVSER